MKEIISMNPIGFTRSLNAKLRIRLINEAEVNPCFASCSKTLDLIYPFILTLFLSIPNSPYTKHL